MDDNVAGLLDSEDAALVAGAGTDKAWPPEADQNRVGIRTLRVSPDGRHLASGDRVGVLRWGEGGP